MRGFKGNAGERGPVPRKVTASDCWAWEFLGAEIAVTAPCGSRPCRRGQEAVVVGAVGVQGPGGFDQAARIVASPTVNGEAVLPNRPGPGLHPPEVIAEGHPVEIAPQDSPRRGPARA